MKFAAVLILTFSSTFLWAGPAAAHADKAVSLTNYRTDIKLFEPKIPGVTLTANDLGEKLKLVNDTSEEIGVDGYEGEPYLRVGKAGSLVNTKSPAFYLNQTVDGSSAQPPSADAKAPPEWKKLSSDSTVSWHDHRAHWMGVDDPPEVKSAPDVRRDVIPEWTITMHHGQQTLTASGSVTYVPPVSRLPWLALATVAALLAALLVIRKEGIGRVPAAVIGALIFAFGAHFAGELSIAGLSFDDVITVVVALAMGALAIVLALRHVEATAWVALFVAALVAVIGGLSDVSFLSNSQLPTSWPIPMARAIVALVIGIGAGAAAGYIWTIRRQMTA